MRKLFTSESVTEGHPDKLCDQVSDAVLDALLAQDPMSRVACETCATTGMVMVMGEITTTAKVDIPAIVRDWDEVRRLEAALVENLQRDDLNPIEEATGVNRLMEQCGLTQEAAAERLGRSRSAVANLLRLLTLPEPIRHMLEEGALTSGHARALIPLPEETQLKLAAMAAEQGWSVRQMEKMCAQLQQEKPAEDKPKKTGRDPEFVNLERMARDVFGARAELNGDANRGKLVIHYQSSDDLQRIWEMLELMEQNQA